jgi:hypothetical protein
MKTRILSALVVVGALLSTLPATDDVRAEVGYEKQPQQLRTMQEAANEASRLKDTCLASDPRLCAPEPACDVQGQRPEPWQSCVLAWVPDAEGKEKLSWVDEWKLENFKYRRPIVNAHGNLD